MTLLDSDPPATSTQEPPSLDDFAWAFPDQRKLDDLRSLQKEERDYLESIERNGAVGRVVRFLRDRLEERAIEIKTLEANGRFPSVAPQ